MYVTVISHEQNNRPQYRRTYPICSMSLGKLYLRFMGFRIEDPHNVPIRILYVGCRSDVSYALF